MGIYAPTVDEAARPKCPKWREPMTCTICGSLVDAGFRVEHANRCKGDQ